jgi:zinc transporter ZupT
MASIMVAAGRSRRDAVLAASFLGAVTVAGTLGTTLLQGSVRIALPVSAGAAIYVAASDLIPAVNEAKGIKKPLGVFAGVLLFYATEGVLAQLGL